MLSSDSRDRFAHMRPDREPTPEMPPTPAQLQHEREVRAGHRAALMGLSPILFAIWRLIHGKDK